MCSWSQDSCESSSSFTMEIRTINIYWHVPLCLCNNRCFVTLKVEQKTWWIQTTNKIYQTRYHNLRFMQPTKKRHRRLFLTYFLNNFPYSVPPRWQYHYRILSLGKLRYKPVCNRLEEEVVAWAYSGDQEHINPGALTVTK